MIALILGIALVGFLVWIITTYIPMPQAIKTLIVTIAIVLIVIYLLQVTGVMNWITTYIPMPQAIKTLIVTIAIVLIVIYLLQVTGVMNWGPPIPRAR